MTRRLSLTLATLLLASVLAYPPVSGHASDAYHNSLDAVGTSNPDWMGDLPGELKLSELSLPATHDSMSFLFPIPPVDLIVRTQSMTLSQQLQAGIRVFDMRLYNIKDERFEMYHGLAPLFAEFDLADEIIRIAEFERDVLTPIREFLRDHDQETVIMQAGPTSDVPVSGTDFPGLFRRYMDKFVTAGGRLWSPYQPNEETTDPDDFTGPENNPTLNDLRGKLVLLQTVDGKDANGNDWGIWQSTLKFGGGNWDLRTKFDMYEKWDNGIPAAIQLEGGATDVKHSLENADNSTTDEIWSIGLSASTGIPGCLTVVIDEGESFTSAVSKLLALASCVAGFLPVHPAFAASGHAPLYFNDWPREWTGFTDETNHSTLFPDYPRRSCLVFVTTFPFVALQNCIDYEGFNVLAMDFINSGRVKNKVGILWADYPGPGLIEAIIRLNFANSNAPPTVGVPTLDPTPAELGRPVIASATFIDSGGDDDGPYTCFVNYGDGIVVQAGVSAGTCTGPEHEYPDFALLFPVTVTVTVADKHGAMGRNSVSLVLDNVAVNSPTMTVEPSNEGSAVSASATFGDLGASNAKYTCTIDYGDGGGPRPGTVDANICAGPSHSYADNGVYEVHVGVTDMGGRTRRRSSLHTVINVPPTVNSPTVNPEPSNEGSPIAASATFADPGVSDGPHTCSVDYGDGSGPQAGTINGNTCTGPSHVYADDSTYEVRVRVTDKDGDTHLNSSIHVVNNVAPAVNALTVSPEPFNEGGPIAASAAFSDPGVDDAPYSCTVDYGDGSGPQTGSIGGKTCTGPSHTYADNGNYVVLVRVTDGDGGTGENSANPTVRNVKPTASFANSTPPDIFRGEPATLVFTNAFDPGSVDTSTGFLYSYDCTKDGSFEQRGDAASFACTYPGHGAFKALGRIQDKDGGFSDYTVDVLVLSPQQAAQTIIDRIKADLCDAGVLNKGQCNSLTVKLKHAIERLDQGNSRAASNVVNALINEVNDYVNGRILTVEQGQAIIDLARRLLTSMG